MRDAILSINSTGSNRIDVCPLEFGFDKIYTTCLPFQRRLSLAKGALAQYLITLSSPGLSQDWIWTLPSSEKPLFSLANIFSISVVLKHFRLPKYLKTPLQILSSVILMSPLEIWVSLNCNISPSKLKTPSAAIK